MRTPYDTTPAVPAGTFDPAAGLMGAGASFHEGDPVWVHASGSWYQGTVAATFRTNVLVRFTTGGGERTKTVNPSRVEAGNLRPGAVRGSDTPKITSPLVLHPGAYRALQKGRMLRPEETSPTCECGASRDPWTGVLRCAR